MGRVPYPSPVQTRLMEHLPLRLPGAAPLPRRGWQTAPAPAGLKSHLTGLWKDRSGNKNALKEKKKKSVSALGECLLQRFAVRLPGRPAWGGGPAPAAPPGQVPFPWASRGTGLLRVAHPESCCPGLRGTRGSFGAGQCAAGRRVSASAPRERLRGPPGGIATTAGAARAGAEP